MTTTSTTTAGALPSELRFDLDADTVTSKADEVVATLNAAHDAVARVSLDATTWQNVVEPLLDVENALHATCASLVLPMYTHVDKAVRDASSAANAKLDKHQVELAARRDVYERLDSLRSRAKSGAVALDALQLRLLGKMCEDYERQGVALPADKSARLTAINQRIAEIGVQFQKALNEENSKLLFTEAELAGLSSDFVNALPQQDGKRVVTLKYTDLFPVLKQATLESTRRAVEEANSNKCPENVQLMEEALTLRLEAAQLLGYESDAAFQQSVLMAKTPATVNEFLADLTARLAPKADAERAELLALKQQMCAAAGLPFDGKLWSHDWRFYQQQLQNKVYAVDDEKVKQYFPFDHVATTMFDLYQHLFDVRFAEVKPGSPHHRVWHADVRQFVVTDAADGAELGSFFLDLAPRDGKYGHACVMPLVPTYTRADGKRSPLIAAMLANFSKPTADKPSLLYHEEVVTFFHEFGHAIHGIVSMARFARFSGTSVERDFVECPSQMLENWVWDARVLRKASKHVETGEPLPDELIKQMIAAKNMDTGIFNLRQIFFACIDQRVHSAEWDRSKNDTGKMWREMWYDLTKIEPSSGNGMASFGHLLGGYSARYYGYLWSQVFSADLYSKFEHDVFDAAVGRRYRDIILAPGGQRDSMHSLELFLGRKPNNRAFLKSIGLSV